MVTFQKAFDELGCEGFDPDNDLFSMAISSCDMGNTERVKALYCCQTCFTKVVYNRPKARKCPFCGGTFGEALMLPEWEMTQMQICCRDIVRMDLTDADKIEKQERRMKEFVSPKICLG